MLDISCKNFFPPFLSLEIFKKNVGKKLDIQRGPEKLTFKLSPGSTDSLNLITEVVILGNSYDFLLS